MSARNPLEFATITAAYLNTNITHIIAHFPFKLVSKETAVDTPIAGLDMWTEKFAIVSACVVQLSVIVVVIGLQLRNSQHLPLA